MKRLILTVAAAFVLWGVMFSPVTGPYINFWLMMAFSAALLSSLAFVSKPDLCRGLKPGISDILLGAAIAAALWGVFWAGDRISSMIFDFARPQVNEIYAMKSDQSRWLLSLLLLLVIGPAEEIFWRGYVQRTLGEKWGADMGFIAATGLYTLVHVSSFNFMLIMAALTAGAAWGALYRFFPQRFAAIVISHALWDAAVFIWWPI